MVWYDEFDGNGAIDTSKWYHQTQPPNGSSWYNGEIQHYTDRVQNSHVNDGTMKIVAQRETYTDQGHTKDFTSSLKFKVCIHIWESRGSGKITRRRWNLACYLDARSEY